MPIPRTEHRGNQDNKLGKGRDRIKWLAIALLALMLLTTASAQEFTGTATGFGGPVTITISVENGAIAACIITAEQETPSIGGQAAKTMEETIAQTGAADAVSVATMTSSASGRRDCKLTFCRQHADRLPPDISAMLRVQDEQRRIRTEPESSPFEGIPV